MKIFYFFGRNPALKSNFSMKMWKIERRGGELFAAWGGGEDQ